MPDNDLSTNNDLSNQEIVEEVLKNQNEGHFKEEDIGKERKPFPNVSELINQCKNLGEYLDDRGEETLFEKNA